MVMLVRRIMFATMFLLGAASGARAAVLFDNSAVDSGMGPLIASLPVGDGYLGQSFFTGGSSATLADITLGLSSSVNDPGPGSFIVQLFADADGGFGSRIPDLSAPILTLGVTLDGDVGGPVTYDGAHTALAPMTRYWVVVTDLYQLNGCDISVVACVAPTSTTQWDQALDTTGPGVTGEWAYTDGSSSQYGDGQTSPFVMTVDVVVAPEPATIGLMAVGLAGLAFRRRRSG